MRIFRNTTLITMFACAFTKLALANDSYGYDSRYDDEPADVKKCSNCGYGIYSSYYSNLCAGCEEKQREKEKGRETGEDDRRKER